MAWVKQSVGSGFEDKCSFSRLCYTTMAKLAQNPGQLAMIRAAAGHRDVVPGVLSEEQAEIARARIMAMGHGGDAASIAVASMMFSRGKIVRHKPSGRKVTILRAQGSDYEVCDASTGKKFLAKAVNLKALGA